MTIFDKTTIPDANLFFKSHDPKDVRIGQLVSTNQCDYPKSQMVILGCPQDEGVRRNNGRIGAAQAPDKIRQSFYKLSAPAKLKSGVLFDGGNTLIGETLEETHENQFEIVSQLLDDGKLVVVLGGGNDISYPDCKALSKKHNNIIAFNIDSHFDVRENPIRNSGTPYRQLLEEKLIAPANFFELAGQPFANAELYKTYLARKKVKAVELEKFRKKGIRTILNAILKSRKQGAIFWGIDMDSVRSADAPGVSASYPTGLTADEIISIAKIAGQDKRSKLFEISEVNPVYDIDNRTCKLAALLIYSYLENKL